MLSTLAQAAIGVFGLVAMWCALGRSERLRRWAPVIGLAGQPAWFWFAIEARAPGVLLVSFCWTVVYAWRGWQLWNDQPRDEPEPAAEAAGATIPDAVRLRAVARRTAVHSLADALLAARMRRLDDNAVRDVELQRMDVRRDWGDEAVAEAEYWADHFHAIVSEVAR